MAKEPKKSEGVEAPLPEAVVPETTVEEPVVEEAVVEEAVVPETAVEEAVVEEPVVEEAVVEEAPAEPEAIVEAESEAAPAATPKKRRSGRHVPRTERRTRTATKREPSATRKPIVRLPKPEAERRARQERRGIVVSDKADKTIVVKVDVIKLHPRYKKVVRRTVKFHAHDESNQAGLGDTVRIVETRPLSKTKRWRLAEIVEKAK
jgi:small subunit ribosomal protein S17